MHPSFSIGEAVRFGWHTVLKHKVLVFQVMLTMAALNAANALMGEDFVSTPPGIALSFALGALGFFVGTGLIVVVLRLAKGEHASYRQLFPNWRVVLRFFGANILVGLTVMLPLLCGALLAGGAITFYSGPAAWVAAAVLALATVAVAIYLAITYSLVRFAVIDGAGITGSLKKSSLYTHGVKWKLLGFTLVLGLVNLLGLLVLIVGLLVTVPLTMIAAAHVYLKLKARHS